MTKFGYNNYSFLTLSLYAASLSLDRSSLPGKDKSFLRTINIFYLFLLEFLSLPLFKRIINVQVPEEEKGKTTAWIHGLWDPFCGYKVIYRLGYAQRTHCIRIFSSSTTLLQVTKCKAISGTHANADFVSKHSLRWYMHRYMVVLIEEQNKNENERTFSLIF
jgi:hypothetical protein